MKKKQFVALTKFGAIPKKHIFLMKLSFSVYLFCCFQLIASHGHSQDKVTLSVNDTSLESILNQIEKQTSYSFVYNNDEINIHQKFDFAITDKTVNKVIGKLLDNTSIDYIIKNQFVILSKKRAAKSGQEKFTISGSIKDSETGETLLGANVLLKDGTKGTTTNEYGFYSITLLKGNYTLQVSYLGYESKEVELALDTDLKRDFELVPASNELDEVVLTSDVKNKSQVDKILTGVVDIKPLEIKQLPAFLGEPDLTRAILTQPGVNSVGEGTTGFNVRGGNIDQNLILLDEAPIYNSAHLWGLFSIVNVDAIKDIKFYKGGTPARFGGRGSSVLEIRQKEGNSKEFRGEGGIGILDARLTLEGPIKKDKINFLLSGRRTYFDLFFPLLGDEVKDNKLYFHDFSTKLTWNINENNKVFASGYFGADVMKLKFDDVNTDNNGNEVKGRDEEVDFRWKNTTATLRWNHIFSNKLFMNLSGIYSNYNYSLFSKNDSGGGPVGTTGSFKWTSSVENWIVKPDLTFYLNPETKMRFGIHNTLYRFTPAKIKGAKEGINDVNFDIEKGLEIAPYYELEKKWKNLSVNLGLRYSWFGNIGPYTVSLYNPNFPQTPSTVTESKKYGKGKLIKSYSGFEPRLSIKYNVNDNNAFKIGYNRMYQYIHLITNSNAALPFDVWKPSGLHIKPLKVDQFSTGYAFDSKNGIYNFSLEGYYKTFNNIIEYKNGANIFINDKIETQLIPAKGYAYGAELSLHKNKGKFTGNANYTYSVSKRKTISKFQSDNINNGAYFPSNYDRPHIFNLTTNYKLGKKWSMGAFFTYQTGRPATIATSRFRLDKDPLLVYSDRNAFRLKDIHRLDISFVYTPKGNPNTKWKGSWNFGVYNVYGRKNAFSNYYAFENKNSKVKAYQFSLIGSQVPFLSYNFEF